MSPCGKADCSLCQKEQASRVSHGEASRGSIPPHRVGPGNLERMPGASTLLRTVWGPVYTVMLRRAAIRPGTCIARQSKAVPQPQGREPHAAAQPFLRLLMQTLLADPENQARPCRGPGIQRSNGKMHRHH